MLRCYFLTVCTLFIISTSEGLLQPSRISRLPDNTSRNDLFVYSWERELEANRTEVNENDNFYLPNF